MVVLQAGKTWKRSTKKDKVQKWDSWRVRVQGRLVLFFHAAKDAVVIVVNASSTTRVGVTEFFFIGKAFVVHVDVFALVVVVVAVTSTDAGLLCGYGGAPREGIRIIESQKFSW